MNKFPERLVILTISLTTKGIKESIEEAVIETFFNDEEYASFKGIVLRQNHINIFRNYYSKGLNKFLYYSLCEKEKLSEVREAILKEIRENLSKKLNYLNTLMKHLEGV